MKEKYIKLVFLYFAVSLLCSISVRVILTNDLLPNDFDTRFFYLLGPVIFVSIALNLWPFYIGSSIVVLLILYLYASKESKKWLILLVIFWFLSGVFGHGILMSV